MRLVTSFIYFAAACLSWWLSGQVGASLSLLFFVAGVLCWYHLLAANREDIEEEPRAKNKSH